MKSRILIHSMTLFRDLPFAYVLARVLEGLGCECIVASNENYLSRWVQLWQPHAVFYITASRTERLLHAYPKAKLFYCAAEGGEDYEHFDEKLFLKRTDLFERIERIFLWGRNTEDHVARYLEESKEPGLSNGFFEMYKKKFLIVGYPRLDFVKFGEDSAKKHERTNIGLIGNFFCFNSVYEEHPISRLLDHPVQADEMRYSLDLMDCYLKIMKRFSGKEYSFSLRPYPLESRKAYLESKLVREGKLAIDESFDFSSWLMNQDIVIGDFSSTLAPIVMSGKIYINVSRLVHFAGEACKSKILNLFRDYLVAKCPGSSEELYDMIERRETPVKYSEDLIGLLDYLYCAGSSESAIGRIAKEMMRCLVSSARGKRIRIPRVIAMLAISAMDSVRVRKFKYKKNYKSYSFFRMKSLRKRLSMELEPVVSYITKQLGPEHEELRGDVQGIRPMERG